MPWAPRESGNLLGRPPVGKSLAESIRARFPPDIIVDHAEKLLAIAEKQGDVSAGAKVLQILIDRGYGKVIVEAADSGALSPQLSAMVGALQLSPHERRLRALSVVDDGEVIDVGE